MSCGAIVSPSTFHSLVLLLQLFRDVAVIGGPHRLARGVQRGLAVLERRRRRMRDRQRLADGLLGVGDGRERTLEGDAGRAALRDHCAKSALREYPAQRDFGTLGL